MKPKITSIEKANRIGMVCSILTILIGIGVLTILWVDRCSALPIEPVYIGGERFEYMGQPDAEAIDSCNRQCVREQWFYEDACNLFTDMPEDKCFIVGHEYFMWCWCGEPPTEDD